MPSKAVQVLNDEIPLALSPGVLTERQYLAYVEVTSDRIDPTKRLYGECKEGESIARRFVPVKDLSRIPIIHETWALLQWFAARHAAAK